MCACTKQQRSVNQLGTRKGPSSLSFIKEFAPGRRQVQLHSRSSLLFDCLSFLPLFAVQNSEGPIRIFGANAQHVCLVLHSRPPAPPPVRITLFRSIGTHPSLRSIFSGLVTAHCTSLSLSSSHCSISHHIINRSWHPSPGDRWDHDKRPVNLA